MVKVCLRDLKDWNQEYRHSVKGEKLNRVPTVVWESEGGEGRGNILVGSSQERRGISAKISTACYTLFIYGDMDICFCSLYSDLSVSSSWFSNAPRTSTANSSSFHRFLLPQLTKLQCCYFPYYPTVFQCSSNSFWSIAQALLSPPLFTDCNPQYWHCSHWIYPNRFPDANQIIIPFLGASLQDLPVISLGSWYLWSSTQEIYWWVVSSFRFLFAYIQTTGDNLGGPRISGIVWSVSFVLGRECWDIWSQASSQKGHSRNCFKQEDLLISILLAFVHQIPST